MPYLVSGLIAFCLVIASIPTSYALELKLKNSAPLEVEIDPAAPRQFTSVIFTGGSGSIPPELQGLTAILALALKEGPSDLSSEEYRKKLFLLQGEISIQDSARAMSLSITAPPEHFREVLELGMRTLRSPKLDQESFERFRGMVLSNTRARDDNMSSVVIYYGTRHAFGYHPDTLNGAGSQRSIQNITLDQFKEHSAKLFDINKAFAASVGPMAPHLVQKELNQLLFTGLFADKETKPYRPHAFQNPPIAHGKSAYSSKIVLIHREGATDNQIFYVVPEAIQKDRAEKLIADATHQILGGGLSGRLGAKLRKEKGLTYHAGSSLCGSLPCWTIWTFGGTEQVPELLKGVKQVVSAFQKEKLKKAEVLEATQRLITHFKAATELPQDRLGQRVTFRLYGLNPDFLKNYFAFTKQVTPARIENFAQSRLKLEQGYLFLMGDQAKLLPILENQGVAKDQVKILTTEELL